jgi:hypothetical protein
MAVISAKALWRSFTLSKWRVLPGIPLAMRANTNFVIQSIRDCKATSRLARFLPAAARRRELRSLAAIVIDAGRPVEAPLERAEIGGGPCAIPRHNGPMPT